MPNKPKIVGEIEVRVREMCEKGYNATHIGKQVGLSKDTIKSWAEKNGYVLSYKLEVKIIDATPKVVEMIKNGIDRKTIQRELGVHFTAVTKIAIENGLEGYLRTRAISALEDRALTREEVEAKITDGSQYVKYEQSTKEYIFICPRTAAEYRKKVGKIYQGSPYGKTGKQLTEEEFAERLKTVNHTLKPGTYTKTKAPVTVYCSKGHERRLTKASYALSFNCPICGNNGTSIIEQDMLAWVKQFYPSAHKLKLPNNITKPREIDIYIPELKLGIEYCGLWCHGEKLENKIEEGKEEEVGIYGKHYKKLEEANKLGIRLITIFGDEWTEREEQIRGFLKAAMQQNKYRIVARECDVLEISKKEGSEFLDKYHIQGTDESIVYFGLFFKGDLAAVMSAGRHPHRHMVDDPCIYLNRLAFASDLSVIGGSAKLFSALKEYAKRNKYSRIVSWSDNRWSEGGVYEYLGFSHDSQAEKGRGLSDGSIWPDFWYVYRSKRITRWTAEKRGLKDLGLDKIYDCGKKRWVLDLK